MPAALRSLPAITAPTASIAVLGGDISAPSQHDHRRDQDADRKNGVLPTPRSALSLTPATGYINSFSIQRYEA